MKQPDFLVLGAEENPIRDPLIFPNEFMQWLMAFHGLHRYELRPRPRRCEHMHVKVEFGGRFFSLTIVSEPVEIIADKARVPTRVVAEDHSVILH
jgi:hypothetical protein